MKKILLIALALVAMAACNMATVDTYATKGNPISIFTNALNEQKICAQDVGNEWHCKTVAEFRAWVKQSQ